MKKSQECQNLNEVRQEIDRIDREMMRQFSERYEYVKAASKFKPNVASIAAPDRVASMLEERKLWAKEESFDIQLGVKLFEQITRLFIEAQTKYWLEQNILK